MQEDSSCGVVEVDELLVVKETTLKMILVLHNLLRLQLIQQYCSFFTLNNPDPEK